MLHLRHFGIPSRFLSLMRKQELSLLGFSTCGTLFNFSLTIIESFTLLIQLTLQVNHLALFLLLQYFKLLTETFIELTLFLVSLIHIVGFAHLVARL